MPGSPRSTAEGRRPRGPAATDEWRRARRGPCHGWLSIVRRTSSVVAVAAVDVGQVVVPGAKLTGPASRGRVGGTRLLTGPGGKAHSEARWPHGPGRAEFGLLVGLAQQAKEGGRRWRGWRDRPARGAEPRHRQGRRQRCTPAVTLDVGGAGNPAAPPAGAPATLSRLGGGEGRCARLLEGDRPARWRVAARQGDSRPA
jgi:hypothetical protein